MRITEVRSVGEVKRNVYTIRLVKETIEKKVSEFELEMLLDGTWYYVVVQKHDQKDWEINHLIFPVVDAVVYFDRACMLSDDDCVSVMDELFNHPRTRLLLLLNE